MSIQLAYTEDFSIGLKRLMINECNTALDYLKKSDTMDEKHKAVHETRKAFKKIRGCLRLVRDHIEYYKKENAWFRDLGREISGIRDRTANIETLNVLLEQYDSQLYEKSFNVLEDELQQDREKVAKKVFREENRLEKIRKSVEKKIKAISGWPIDIKTFDDIRPSIKRTYKRGRKGLQNSKKNGGVEDLHEWRKRGKYLRYQLDVLNRLWPQMFETLEDELHDITNFTGTFKDLHNLHLAIKQLGEPFTDETEKLLFNAIVEKHRRLMKEHALMKGEKFYFDTPGDFCDRIELYWNIHQQEISNGIIVQPKKLEHT
ncbi:CHAD domain-containing protein [Aliifodinibius sp. S!AR15-10]|uniref:CHAD domain-containing protein n=1 Tax=Aliifodinibius sp. S!AR15-10 TaxID=2950437 RepID=UPI002863E797|nr:CHAD domain-containing protein [Aliifodinibius sp. S!AR15-10]MDR8392558.1 CHAD domain-containing protein [Aliifodinibius sp. S!AR15-10]